MLDTNWTDPRAASSDCRANKDSRKRKQNKKKKPNCRSIADVSNSSNTFVDHRQA